MTQPQYKYEAPEKFGESLTTARPWNTSALVFVECLNGRAAMVGFVAAVIGELITGEGITGQLAGMVRWYLNLG